MLKELRRDLRRSGSARLLENLASDQHASDLARACPDFIELGVSQQAAGGKVIDIPISAEALDSLQGHPGCAFGGIENRAGSILPRGAAFIAGTRDHVNVRL